MLLALLSARLVDEFAGFLPAGSFESFRTDLDLTYKQASVVLTVAAPGAIVGTVFSMLADYRSRRVIASAGAFALAVALFVFGVAPDFPTLVVASFVYGCAATALCDASELALVDLSGDDAPAAVSRSHLFGAVGDLFGPLALIAATATGIGWRGAFVVCAVLVCGYAIWVALLPLPGPTRDRGPERARDGLRDVVRDRRVWFCALVALLLGPLDEPFLAFLIAHLERTRGLGSGAATATVMAWTVGTMLALAMTSRVGFRPAASDLTRYAGAMAVAATACVVAPMAIAVAASTLAFGFSTGRFFVALMTRILDLRPGQLGTVYAVISAVEFTGFVFPLAAGAVADAYGVGAGLACYVFVAVTLAAVVAIQARSERAI